MLFVLFQILIALYVVLVEPFDIPLHHGVQPLSYGEAALATSASIGAQTLVPPSTRHSRPDEQTAVEAGSEVGSSSQPGHCFSSTNPGVHGDFFKFLCNRMVLWELSTDEKPQCQLLRSLWRALAGLHGSADAEDTSWDQTELIKEILCSSGTGASTLGRDTTSQESTPESSQSTPQVQKVSQECRKGQAGKRQRARERSLERTSTVPATPVGSTSTTTSPCSSWTITALDGLATASRSPFFFYNGTVSSRAEVEGTFSSSEEGQSGQPSGRASNLCCRRNKGRYQGRDKSPSFCCQSSWTSTRSFGRGFTSSRKPHVAVEILPEHLLGALQAVCRTLQGTGEGAPRGDHQSQRSVGASEGGLPRDRGESDYDFVRRRARLQGRCHAGSRCKDSGGVGHDDRKPPETHSTGRSGDSGRRRAQGQEAQRRKGQRWCTGYWTIAVHAAFWNAWPVTTEVCADRWADAVVPPLHPSAAVLQWGHSILGDRTYLSPWQASENALALAFELHPNSFQAPVGHSALSSVSSLSRKRREGRVHFAKNVEFITGKFDSSHWHRFHYALDSSLHDENGSTLQSLNRDGVALAAEVPQCATRPLRDHFVSARSSRSSCRSYSFDLDEPEEAGTPSSRVRRVRRREYYDDQSMGQAAMRTELQLGGPGLCQLAPKQLRPDPDEVPIFPDPPMHSDESDVPGQPPRPPMRHFPTWVEELWNILQDEGAVEVAAEGIVLKLSSFYISHRTCTQQDAARLIRLNQHYDTWAEHIIAVWRDFFDHHSPFEIHVVRPRPPIPIRQGVAAIILVVQHPVRHAATVLSVTLLDDLHAPRRRERALSVAIHTDFDAFFVEPMPLKNVRKHRGRDVDIARFRRGDINSLVMNPFECMMGLVIEVPMFLNEQVWWRRVAPRVRPPSPRQPTGRNDGDATALMARRPRPRPPPSSTSHSGSSSSSSDSGSQQEHWRRTVVARLLPFSFPMEILIKWQIALPEPFKFHHKKLIP